MILQSCSNNQYIGDNIQEMPINFKVAFIGDQSYNDNSKAVLRLIKDEGTDMVIHSGDIVYESSAEEWEKQINEILGRNFPYFASIGNHDICSWSELQNILKSRLKRIDGAKCVGNYGISSACSYKGLFFILSHAGLGDDDGWYYSNKASKRFAKCLWNHLIIELSPINDEIKYIKDQLTSSENLWKICSWHKPQRLMQVGKANDVNDIEHYEECRKAGAIIITAHERSYVRTYLIDDFKTQSVASTSNKLIIKKGNTFAVVSALGGKGINKQENGLAANNWFASVYTKDQNADFGALFCTFNKGGIDNNAECYFKDIQGRIPDEFEVVNLG